MFEETFKKVSKLIQENKALKERLMKLQDKNKELEENYLKLYWASFPEGKCKECGNEYEHKLDCSVGSKISPKED